MWGFKWLGSFGNNSRRNFLAILLSWQRRIASKFQHNRLRIGLDSARCRSIHCRDCLRIDFASVLLPLYAKIASFAAISFVLQCVFWRTLHAGDSESTKTKETTPRTLHIVTLFGTFGLSTSFFYCCFIFEAHWDFEAALFGATTRWKATTRWQALFIVTCYDNFRAFPKRQFVTTRDLRPRDTIENPKRSFSGFRWDHHRFSDPIKWVNNWSGHN